MNKNMVYRILNTLEKENWVYLDAQTGKYQLTLQPFQITSRSLHRLSLNNAALPLTYSLWEKTGESTYLAVMREDSVVYIQHLDSVKSVKVSGTVGGSYPLHCSAPGKVLLAYSDIETIDRYCTRTLEKMTEHTITDPQVFRSYLAKVRENGYATDLEELDMESSAMPHRFLIIQEMPLVQSAAPRLLSPVTRTPSLPPADS